MNTLDQICAKKRASVDARKASISLDDLRLKIADIPAPRGFLRRMMEAEGPALIAEIKKASPSKGLIRQDFDPALIAKIYADHGATCISILTDAPYFQGSDSDFLEARKTVNLPLLRKDFMIDPYQIYESRAMGADCILLIMAALSDDLAKQLYALSLDLQMDILIEVHDENELDRALKLNPIMIGVNNRSLKTLHVDIQTSFDLALKLPSTCFKVAESGISDHATLQGLYRSGYQGFLVGESLMRQTDIGAATRALLNGA